MPYRRNEDPIRLAIRPNVEIFAPDINKPFLLIEGDAAWVSLPDAQPQVLTPKRAGCLVNGSHKQLRHALSVGRAVDIETVQLDRLRLGNARGWLVASNLGVGEQRFRLECQQRRDVRIGEFHRLLWHVVR